MRAAEIKYWRTLEAIKEGKQVDSTGDCSVRDRHVVAAHERLGMPMSDDLRRGSLRM